MSNTSNSHDAARDYEGRVIEALSRVEAERDRARHLAKHLFQMVEPQAWRDSGGDDGQGHYEGDYHAAKVEEEIRSWA